MTPLSLAGVATHLPERVVDNAFFAAGDGAGRVGMFKGAKLRHHVAPDETAVQMIAKAATKLIGRLGLQPARDVDILLTNVPINDQPFTGCGASVAKVLGLKPQWIIDMQNTGCISFVFMAALARSLMSSSGAKTALVCNVQNSAGRIFAHEDNRKRPQSAIPGDGCGVAYLVANDENPFRSIVTKSFGEYADDMAANLEGGAWWEPRATSLHLDFSESRIASIVSRGNALVPQVVRDACREAGVRDTKDIDVLVTNQPNPIFLRNWREALLLPPERHVHTFEEHGNLFGAAVPICIERALERGLLKKGARLAVGGFSHAGDYAAAAIIDWGAGTS
jgi:3-oxoacyl-[acyl-carrier-protein] synthase-3